MNHAQSAKTQNLETGRSVRREMARHSLDCGEVQVSITHGTVYLHGRVRPLRGHEERFEESMAGLLKSLRQRREIRDVVAEWTAII